MKRIIFATHGINTKLNKGWQLAFAKFAKEDLRFKDDIIIPYNYGLVTAIFCVIPFIKYFYVNKMKKKLREIINKYPDYELNILAHSYGTELNFWAIKTSGEDGKPPIKVNNLILIASVVSRHYHIPYNDTLRAGKIKALHNYCSYEDDVTANAPFGHSGTWGFAKDKYDSKCYPKPIEDLEIYNHQEKDLEHSDYFLTDKYYKEWLDIIDAKTNS